MNQSFVLNNGLSIPMIGLGTYKSIPQDLKAVLPLAVSNGYRLFDTATVYRNEEAIGEYLREALKENNLERSDIFITSKLAPADQGYQKAIDAVKLSLEKLKLDYIDLYLIHWPGTAKLDPSDPRNSLNRRESWRGLEECVRQGLVKSIGVSNFTASHLKEMLEYAQIMPAVHQFELHPAFVQQDVISFCQEHNIFIQTYASLGEGVLLEAEFLKRNPKVIEIAAKRNVSVAQVLLKWPLQRGWGIIPKSVKPERVIENSALHNFSLDAEDMEYLNNFHYHESFKKCWNPEGVV